MRPYTLKRRAEKQEETRRRIVDAAVSLHSSVGPAATTISAIADQAGVERLTVYRHFPDELELLRACSGQWLADNPPPDPAPWASISTPSQRLRAALIDIYAYYERTESMMANLLRDGPGIPFLAEQVAAFQSLLRATQEILAYGWPEPSQRLNAALGHAIEFETWRSLVRRHGLTTDEAVRLMVVFVRAAPNARTRFTRLGDRTRPPSA
jgi:AcrR family transcriptional regulator